MNALFTTQRVAGGGALVSQYVNAIVNLLGTSSTQVNTSGTASVTVTPAARTVNLVGSPSVQTAQSGVGAVTVQVANPIPASVTVPTSRTAKFAGRSRVVAFTGSKPVSVPKVPGDELYYVGDFTKDLFEASTTATSIAPLVAGVSILEGPVLQNGMGVVKLGGLDTSGGENFFTFRVTCANGEQFDRTINFTQLDDQSKLFGKDPDDKRFYCIDLTGEATFGGTSLASVLPPVPSGVSLLSSVSIQGNQVTLKVGGLDTANGAVNSCSLTATFANGEKIVRTIYFTLEEH